MKIYYKSSNKEPSEGDLKVKANGDKFFRKQNIYNGCYVVSNGKPCYNWYNYNDKKVEHFREIFEKEGMSIYYNNPQKPQKCKKIRLNLQNEIDRERYQKLTGIPVSSDTSITTVVLTVSSSKRA